MRKLLSKRPESVISIVIVAGFAAVAMALNAGRLAYFAGHDPTQLTDSRTPPRVSTLYAESVWKGKSIWKPIDLGPDGLSMTDFIRQMYEKTFPAGRTQGSPLHEGRSDLPHYVHVVGRHPDGTVFLDVTGHNIRTNAGINWQYNQMAGTAAAVCNYIALSDATLTPNVTDTTLASEITTNGLQRVTGAPTHSSNATSYTLVNVFTATSAQAAKDTAIFNAASNGTMCFENTFTEATLATNDTLTVTWTITF